MDLNRTTSLKEWMVTLLKKGSIATKILSR